MLHVRDLCGQVFASLFRNKLRTLLTMAGIAWGIASIVIIVAMGDGFKEGQRNNMKGLGENLVILFGGQTEMQAGGQRAGRAIHLQYADVEAIRQECYLVSYTVAELSLTTKVVSQFNSGQFDTAAVEADFNKLRNIPLASGRFVNESDERDGSRVVILGPKVKEQLFGKRNDVIGANVFVNSLPFRVIGLMADKDQNSSYGGFDEKKIFIPYSTAVRDTPPTKPYFVPGDVDDIIYRPKSLESFDAARKQVLGVLGRRHDFNPTDKGAVFVWDTVEDAKEVDAIFGSMTIFLSTIAVVTLSLGGIGVMNIMLVTVSERTREVGLRKALGATRRRILLDFFLEGVILATVSGFVGWAMAFGLSSLLKLVKMPDSFPGLPVSMTTTLIAFTALLLVAVAASMIPASRAASLTPVEALRDER